MNAARMSMVVAIALLAASCSGVMAQGAAGLEPGVHVDPGSPSAKEYALPLTQGRQTGAGSTGAGSPGGGSTSSTGSETPFGAGIKPPGSGGPGSHSGSGSRAGSGSRSAGAGARGAQRTGGTSSGSPGGQEPQVSLPPLVQQSEDAHSSGGAGSLPVLIGGGVAILVLGGFGGTVLRHSRRPNPSR
jgi:hypothetical protein